MLDTKLEMAPKSFGIVSVDRVAESKIRLLKTDNAQENPGPDSIVYWRIMSFERQVSTFMVNSFILRHNKVSRSVVDPGFSRGGANS